MPLFAPPQQAAPAPAQAPRRPAVFQPSRQQPPARSAARNDRYLPPMPDMLRAPSNESKDARQGQMAAAPAGGKQNLVIRGQTPDEPFGPARPPANQARLLLPTPEELGLQPEPAAHASKTIAATPAVAIGDWTSARDRLEKLGASYYRLEKAPEGGYRFACALPSGAGSAERQFEARGASENEAIRLALQQVETWKAQQRK